MLCGFAPSMKIVLKNLQATQYYNTVFYPKWIICFEHIGLMNDSVTQKGSPFDLLLNESVFLNASIEWLI